MRAREADGGKDEDRGRLAARRGAPLPRAKRGTCRLQCHSLGFSLAMMRTVLVPFCGVSGVTGGYGDSALFALHKRALLAGEISTLSP